MDPISRAIGRLEAAQKASRDDQEEHKAFVRARLEKIDQKLDSLLRFKWQAIGIGSAIGFIASLVVSVLTR